METITLNIWPNLNKHIVNEFIYRCKIGAYMDFRIFVGAHEFRGVVAISYNRGNVSGPWEDSEPSDVQISVEEIEMKNGSRSRQIRFDSLNEKAQDRIREEISDDFFTALRKEKWHCGDDR